MTTLVVEAGYHPRRGCPVQTELPASIAANVVALRDPHGREVPCQTEPAAEPGHIRLMWIVDDLLAGETRRYELVQADDATARQPDTGITLTEREGTRLEIATDGSVFTSYYFAGEIARPYFHPLRGPDGAPVTRGFPMVPDVPGETRDHPHHRGLYFAHGDVNGTNNWSEGPDHSRMRHLRFSRVVAGAVYGTFTEELHWLDPDGDVVMAEERTVTIYRTGSHERLLDASLTFRATAGAITFGDTKEGGLISVRVATSMDAKSAGRIENAAGGVQEAETWGKRAHWCDYSGPVNSHIIGICLMDHPDNLRHPTYWHVRAYGLMTANPFGLHDYFGDPSRRGDWTLPEGAQRTFRYRVLIHRGNARDAGLRERYHEFANPPAVTVEGG